jgi:N4-gp56 family major capsid protein
MAFDTATNASLLTTYLEKRFVPTLEADLQYYKFCMKGVMPNGVGKIIRWNEYSEPTGNTTPLTEGTDTGNEIASLTTTGTDGTLQEFGEFINMTTLAELASVPGQRQQVSDRLSYGAALTIDTLIRDGQGANPGALDTTTDWYAQTTQAGGSETPATPTAASASWIVGAATILRKNKARGLKGVPGHPDGHLAAIVSTTAERDIVTEGSTSRVTWAQAVTNVPGMSGQEKWVEGYMGSIYGTACYRTQNFTQSTVTSLSDNSVMIAEGGLGTSALVDMEPRVWVNDELRSPKTPYRNHISVSWHIYFTTRLLSNSRVVRMYSLA